MDDDDPTGHLARVTARIALDQTGEVVVGLGNRTEIARIDKPAATPRLISSRSATVNADDRRRRPGGAIPPRSRSVRWIVPGARSSAGAISLTDSPADQRAHNSGRSAGE